MKQFIEDVYDVLKEFLWVLPRMIVVFIIAETIVLGPLFLIKWLVCRG